MRSGVSWSVSSCVRADKASSAAVWGELNNTCTVGGGWGESQGNPGLWAFGIKIKKKKSLVLSLWGHTKKEGETHSRSVWGVIWFGTSQRKTSLSSYVTTRSTLHNTHPSPWTLVIPWLHSLRTQGRVVGGGGLHGPTLIVVVQLKITASLQGASASPLPEPSLALATEVCLKTVERLRENCKRKNRRHNGLRNGAGHQ